MKVVKLSDLMLKLSERGHTVTFNRNEMRLRVNGVNLGRYKIARICGEYLIYFTA